MSRTAFLTGATGFLGRNLVEQLVAQGWVVHALHRTTSNLAPLAKYPITWTPGDILDAESLARAIPAEADAVFHVAANISMWKPHAAAQWAQNVDGTRHVLEAARAQRARSFVFTSSWASYGLGNGAVSEEMPQRGGASPRNYAKTKHAAEDLVRAAVEDGLHAVVMNPSHIVGRYDTGGWGRMFKMVEAGTLPGVPSGSGSFCHSVEVAKAHIAAVDRGQSGHNYLLGGTDAAFHEVVGIIGQLTGKPVPKRPVPGWALKLLAHAKEKWSFVTRKEPDLTPEIAHTVTHHPRILSDKAAAELGYRAVPLREMLSDAHAWMVSAGHLSS